MAKTFEIPALLDDDSTLYEGSDSLDPVSFEDNIEPIDLEDIDRAVFDLIDKKINIHTTNTDSISIKVPVIFATGERWALVRQRKALRDENGTIILPLISIRRMDVDRTHEASLPAGSPALKSLVYKIKRSTKNSGYQNLRNSLGLRNQDNAAKNVGTNTNPPSSKTSRRTTARAFSGTVFRGKKLVNKKRPEVVDIYTIPYPDFFKVDYEISFWAQYQVEMNEMSHRYFNEFETFSIDSFKIQTNKGYYFIGFGQGIVTNESNLDEFTDTERIIRQTVSLEIPAYSIQTQLGEEHLVHKYTSMPEISFSVIASDEDITDLDILKQKNPLEKYGTLNDLEEDRNLSTTAQVRPRATRRAYKSITRKVKKRYVGETVGNFPNLDELERFFK
tara:strand:- start:8681 stop:9850 length:1170 start_codon:yes stop_codon:yes gene_type:complete